MSSVRILKLSTGEDIMGKISEIDVNGQFVYMVENPVIILMSPKSHDNPFEMSLGIAPYVPYAKESKIMIMPHQIIALFEAETKLANEYNSRFGSGIVVPDTSLSKSILKG